MTRTIAVVTVARSDYGILLPLLRRIHADPQLDLQLIVTGMHLAPQYGMTVRQIEADGFPIVARVPMLLADDTPESISKSMGIAQLGFAQLFQTFRPDMLVVTGDRFEMFMPALAALPFRIPIAHIHGGEVTVGAIDDALRHSLTKLSHLHFVSTPAYGERIIRMGEMPWRVTVCGAPALENLNQIALLSVDELKARYQLGFEQPPLLVTYHPVTLAYEKTAEHIDALLQALSHLQRPVVFTLPNADTHSHIIQARIHAYLAAHPNAWLVENFGTQGYFSMMAVAAAMAGNSSSGILEAASFKLPVVNIGTRQQGRIRGNNVIDAADGDTVAIQNAIEQAMNPSFRAALTGENPYQQSRPASELIVERLKSVELGDRLLMKLFFDGEAHQNSSGEP